MEPHELVTVGTYGHSAQAHLARIRLETEGTETVIEDEHSASLGYQYGPAIGGVKLRVVESDRESAPLILYGHQKASSAKRIRCHRCGSKKIARGIHLSVFGVALSSIPLESSNHRLRCKACKHSWRDSS